MKEPLTLAQLATHTSGAVVFGASTAPIEHLTEDSRVVRSGSLFVARNGERVDGRRFVSDAMRRGAAAVLCEKGDSLAVEPRIEVDDIREAWGQFSQLIYCDPSASLKLVGITGTNGKTTVANLVAQALSYLGRTVARGGTMGFFVGDHRISDSLTTPMPDQMARLLAQAVDLEAEFAVLEVSSHALAQKRIADLKFEVVTFTNLSQDHLDYHGTMGAYGAEKERLFHEYSSAAQVLNVSDDFGAALFTRHASARATRSVSTSPDLKSNIYARESYFSREGVKATVCDEGAAYSLSSKLLGKHNLENLLVAWGILRSLGFDAQGVSDALAEASGVPGRLERCESDVDDIVVVVDYAHTPDALRRVLSTLKDLEFTEISCVFGCGGDRDRTKRPLMGQAAAEFADKIYVTSDNPRNESPQAIINDILPGLGHRRNKAEVEIDRRKMIQQAISTADAGACVLIAGKGHEDYQIVFDQVLSFDDRIEAKQALSSRRVKRGVP